MAVAVVKFKNGKKGMGTPHFDYIMRDGKYAPKADDLERLVISDSGNMPSWATDDPKFYWSMADELERENGRIYKEHIIALPRGLDDQQLEQLARDLIKEHIGDKHPYSFAIHAPLATDGKEQPHLHFMYSERTLDGIDRGADTFFKRYNSKNPSKGGCKKANLAMRKGEARQQAKELRYRIGDTINRHLELANRPERVDMRSKHDIERLELEQAQADLEQELLELEQLEQSIALTDNELKDVLNRLQLEQAEIVVKPQLTPEPPHPTYVNAQDEYNAKRDEIAKQLLKDELKAIAQHGKTLFDEITQLKDNKPFNVFGIGAGNWQKKLDEKLEQYNAIKTKFDELKKQGVTYEHYEQARQQLEQTRPELVQRVKDEFIAEMRADDQRRLEQYRATKATAPTVTVEEKRIFTARLTLYENRHKIMQDPSKIDEALRLAGYRMDVQNILFDPNDQKFADIKQDIDNFAKQVKEMQKQLEQPQPTQEPTKSSKGMDR